MSTSEQATTIELSQTLSPVLSDRFVARWPHVAITAAFASLFLLLSYLPLFHGESWRHVGHGAWILAHGSLPTSEPMLPLAEGMPFQNHGWLAQVGFASIANWTGPEGLSVSLAVLYTTALILFTRAAYLVTGRKLLAMAGFIFCLAVLRPDLNVVQPAAFGFLLLGIMSYILADLSVRRRLRPALWHWFAVPGLMLVWTNIDASFVIGLLLIWAVALGRAIDVGRRTRDIWRVATDDRSRQLIWIAELALVATLINPYGFDLWTAALTGSSHSWWNALGGVQPFNLLSWHGAGFVMLTLMTMVLLRLSRRRLSSAQVILLGVGSTLVLFNQSLLVYYAPLAILCLLPHARAVWGNRSVTSNRSKRGAAEDLRTDKPQSFKFALSLVCVLLVWLGFALSPASRPLLGGKGRSTEQLFDSHTPTELAGFLNQLPRGQLSWAPAYWGDWLAWTQGGKLPVFAGSDVRQLPQQVRHDYGKIYRAEGNWSAVLDRYEVATLIADKQLQPELIAAASHGTSDWTRIYEDQQAVVFVRRNAPASQGGRERS